MTTDVHAIMPRPRDPSQTWSTAFAVLAALAIVLATVHAFWPPRVLVDTTQSIQ